MNTRFLVLILLIGGTFTTLSAQAYYPSWDSLFQVSRYGDDTLERIDANLKLATFYPGEFTYMVKFGTYAYEESQAMGEQKKMASALLLMATGYANLEREEQGHSLFEKALDIYLKLKDQERVGYTQGQLAALQFKMGNKKRAQTLLENAQKTLKEADASRTLTVVQHQYAKVLMDLDYPSKAIPLLEDNFSRQRDLQAPPFLLVNALIPLADCHLQLREWSTALVYLERADSLHATNPAILEQQPFQPLEVSILLARTYFDKGETALAKQALQQHEDWIKAYDPEYPNYKALNLKADIAEKEGRASQATTYRQEAEAIEDAVEKEEASRKQDMIEELAEFEQSQNALQELQADIEQKVKEQELFIAERNNATKRMFYIVALALVGVIVVIIGVVLFLQKKRRSSTR